MTMTLLALGALANMGMAAADPLAKGFVTPPGAARP